MGTLYDQKEQLFRNYGQILGPFSEPILLHKWGEGEAFAATFVWVDPINTVAGSFEVKVDAGVFVSNSLNYFCLSRRWILSLDLENKLTF